MNFSSLIVSTPNTEGSAEPREAIGASWRTQVRIIFLFCSNLPLSSANADNFPDKRGQLALFSLSFI